MGSRGAWAALEGPLRPFHVDQLPDVTVEVLEAAPVHGALVHVGFQGLPPAAIALAIVSSTSCLLSAERAVSTSVVLAASAISSLMKSRKRS